MKKFDLILEGIGILALIILIAGLFAVTATTCPPAAALSAWLVVAVMAMLACVQACHLVSLFK
jgi:uncharacterized membrane protein